MERKYVEIYTDGACSGNPGPGGYAAILLFNGHEKVIEGADAHTTNNRMEIKAAIEGLAVLKCPCSVTVITDSEVLGNAIANLDDMPKKEWRTKTGAKRANEDLLKTLYSIKHAGNHELNFQVIKGHNGNTYNERCDKLAKAQIALMKG